MTTIKQARNYVQTLKAATGKTHIIFKVPKGSRAYAFGIRYGTCEEGEREDYEKGGAEFID